MKGSGNGNECRRVRLLACGDLDAIAVEDVLKPQAAEGEVLVRIMAATVNHLDLDIVRGISRYPVPLPITMGMEGAGIVADVGPGVTDFAQDERVLVASDLPCGKCVFCVSGHDNVCPSSVQFGVTRDGFFSQFAAVPATALYRLPSDLAFETAAATQVAFGTAWHMLVTRARLRAGEWVFVGGAGGSVGGAALQIARLAGARVIAGSGSERTRERLVAAGAQVVVDSSGFDLEARVLDATHGEMVDVVFDHIGGRLFERSLGLLKSRGRLVICGAHSGELVRLDLIRLFRREISVIGATSYSRSELRDVLGLVASGRLTPIVESRFGLESVSDALKLIDSRAQYGRVVILPWK